ncbi:MAG: hypothetical protein H6739_03425 [Alphaproteobacteria bacterium]|nr:hypothetical protein [Alphaproteobacteria bacterium]
MKRFALAALALGIFTGCSMKGSTIPGAPIPFAKADYTVLGATNAEECGSYLFGINFAALFKNEGAMITPGTMTLDGTAGMGAAAINMGVMTAEGSKALYMALEKMPEATHLLAPRVHIEANGVTLGPSHAIVIFGKRCATVEARGVKIGDKPTANQ